MHGRCSGFGYCVFISNKVIVYNSWSLFTLYLSVFHLSVCFSLHFSQLSLPFPHPLSTFSFLPRCPCLSSSLFQSFQVFLHIRVCLPASLIDSGSGQSWRCPWWASVIKTVTVQLNILTSPWHHQNVSHPVWLWRSPCSGWTVCRNTWGRPKIITGVYLWRFTCVIICTISHQL